MRCRPTRIVLFANALVVGFVCSSARAGTPSETLGSVLRQEFHLGGVRSAGTRYFDMTTTLVKYRADGKRSAAETYRLKLRCVSKGEDARVDDRYTCKQFLYVHPDGKEVEIPALKGWTYSSSSANDYVLGIDHARFQNLADQDGNPLGSEESYYIYNTFIDFHTFCDVFATPPATGQGIQNLTRVGQRITHVASNSAPATSLGSHFKTGSYFKNGKITLEFMGLSVIDDRPCAVVGFDSGNGSFQMLMEPSPGLAVKTTGSSHYFGDIHVDLGSKWARRVHMRELVIAQTNVPRPGNTTPTTINSVVERDVVIRLVTGEGFDKD
ncbi:MAG: hypothetical protein ACE1ZA_22575 [Pseudomonadales bacterium]